MSNADSADNDHHLSICETCGWPVRENRKHERQGDNECRVVEIDTERVVGWSRRRLHDVYKR